MESFPSAISLSSSDGEEIGNVARRFPRDPFPGAIEFISSSTSGGEVSDAMSTSDDEVNRATEPQIEVAEAAWYARWRSFTHGAAREGSNIYPTSLSRDRRRALDRFYAAVHEQFYEHSALPIVSPTSALAFMRYMGVLHATVHVWERFSGSGRLSACALAKGFIILFPVDVRYGWDLQTVEHRTIIDEVYSAFIVEIDLHDSNNLSKSKGQLKGSQTA